MAAVRPAQPLPTMITFSTNQSSMSRKSAKMADIIAALSGRQFHGDRAPWLQLRVRLSCLMPELAEVEWFRKQWNPGRGAEIVDLSFHERNRVFRETDFRALREKLIGEKLLGSHRR